MERTLTFGAYTVRLFADSPRRDVVYCPLFAGEAEPVWQRLPAPRPILAAVSGMDWNRELSPWKAPKTFPDGEDFGGGAADFLAGLTHDVLPGVEGVLGDPPSSRSIAGYSLAGLFALWSLYQTDRFQRAASLSGSLWFDSFVDYMEANPLRCQPELVYLSLGDREKQSKSARLSTVETQTRRAAALLEAAGVPVRLEFNPGGHFRDVPARIAKGIQALQ